jgi:short-subunit dehydrogenase
MKVKDPRVVLITGASSGIGTALAEEYAAPGRTLLLTGRDAGRLESVAAVARQKGAAVESAQLDVVEAGPLGDWLRRMDVQHGIDQVIANAGVWGATAPSEADRARAIFDVNVGGLFNTVLPLVDAMKARRRGQIALMASIASFRGFPGFALYCASKAAVRVYGEALRGELKPHGIGVSVICPGYVRSPMTAVNDFKMPFLLEADQAARLISRGLAANKARIAFPLPMYLAAWMTMALSPRLTDPMVAGALL